mmetsp:Transcript_16662/g.45358  ORF Transcript_16662/g.45358 Transcript_16662/m.45358 type:complete len:121 (+) Transcript_16662:1374-1736(+)
MQTNPVFTTTGLNQKQIILVARMALASNLLSSQVRRNAVGVHADLFVPNAAFETLVSQSLRTTALRIASLRRTSCDAFLFTPFYRDSWFNFRAILQVKQLIQQLEDPAAMCVRTVIWGYV